MARFNRTYTIEANPIRLSDNATAATVGEILPPKYVVNFFVQALHGGSGLIWVSTGIPNGVTPAVPPTDGQLTSELSPATATAPGGSYNQNQSAFGSMLAGTVDLTRAWISGANAGDTVVVSYDTTP
jgi:hypothetical protein